MRYLFPFLIIFLLILFFQIFLYFQIPWSRRNAPEKRENTLIRQYTLPTISCLRYLCVRHQMVRGWMPYLDFLERSLSRLSLSLSLRFLSLSLSFWRRSLKTETSRVNVKQNFQHMHHLFSASSPTHRSADLDLLRERLRSRDRWRFRSLPGDTLRSRSLDRERLRLRISRSLPAVSRSFFSESAGICGKTWREVLCGMWKAMLYGCFYTRNIFNTRNIPRN